MDICIATNNAHKMAELRAILVGHALHSPRDLGIEFGFEETGATFLENSLGKARSLAGSLRAAGAPMAVLADDSGLCVDALGGAPGIFSARFGEAEGLVLDARGKNRLLLERMHLKADRACRFVCCMTLVLSADRFYAAQETLEGVLAESASGSGGFGYDPVVFLPGYGTTVAELGEGIKNEISHRAKAARTIERCLG